MRELALHMKIVHPQGVDTLALLREVALEARELYPELNNPNFTWIPPFGSYVDDPISVCYEKPFQMKWDFSPRIDSACRKSFIIRIMLF